MFIELAHSYWKALLSPTDCAIDATAGNGFDTLQLATILLPYGKIFAIDIQKEALEATKKRLQEHFSEEHLQRVSFHERSHATFPPEAHEKPIKLIVYNLGYLPRSDKQIKTLAHSTLESLENGLNLLQKGGMISVMCYPGHEEGKVEEGAVLAWAQKLPPKEIKSWHHTQPNKPNSPNLLMLEKI